MIKLLIIKETEKKILNQAKKYYENKNKGFREQSRNKYRELSDEEKNIKKEYGRNRYQNMSEENKQGLKEYQKCYSEKILVFDKKCIVNNLFQKCKRPVNINEVDIKESYGNEGAFKYFIGYVSNVSIVPLYIKLLQMNAFIKYFDKNNKYMSLLVHDKEILKTYNTVWNKVNNLFKKEFNSEPVYNDKCITAKIILYNVNLYGNKMHRKNERYTCLSVILLDSLVNVNKKYYPQVFLEKCKYVKKRKR